MVPSQTVIRDLSQTGTKKIEKIWVFRGKKNVTVFCCCFFSLQGILAL